MSKHQSHTQVPVKITAFVDKGIASIVQILNEIDGISTFSSCEGEKGKEYAHVYFDLGQYSPTDWIKLAKLASIFANILSLNNIYDANVRLEWTGDKDNPFVAIEFDQQHTSQIASIFGDHKNELTYDI